MLRSCCLPQCLCLEFSGRVRAACLICTQSRCSCRSSALLAQAVLDGEGEASYTWAFQCFRDMLGGCPPPTSWFMDADPAAAIAAKKVFPDTHKFRYVAAPVSQVETNARRHSSSI
jgi:hypothetical protein